VTRRRRLLLALGGATLVAGLAMAFGPPRVVWLNAGPRLEYPSALAIAAGMAASGAALLAGVATKRAWRVVFALAASGLLALAAQRLLYRLEVLEDGVHARGLLGTRHLPWTAVAHVELRSDALVLEDAHAAALEIGTSGLTPDQRASLERTVARRVRETGQAGTGARSPPPVR
jgi:hypothetical protein